MFVFFSLVVVVIICTIRYFSSEKKGRLDGVLTLLTLGLTAVVLIWNTQVLVKNTQIVDEGVIKTLRQNLRPVIEHQYSLGSSVDSYWAQLETGSTTYMSLGVYNNIATNITGYIIVNHKKFQLSFTKSYPGVECAKENDFVGPMFWATALSKLCAYPIKEISKNTDEENEICIQYQDVDGNKYFTEEDKNLSPISGSLQENSMQSTASIQVARCREWTPEISCKKDFINGENVLSCSPNAGAVGTYNINPAASGGTTD